MDKTLKHYNHEIRNLIPLTIRELNLLKEDVSPGQLLDLIKSYNDSLIMCIDVINDNYKLIIKIKN